MPDMVKIIKGLEYCTSQGVDCDAECPYYNAKHVWMTCCDVLMSDALAMLKAQEPCEDAVSREAALEAVEDLRLNDASDELIWLSHVRKQLKALPSVQSSPVARVMTLEGVAGCITLERETPIYMEFGYLATHAEVIELIPRHMYFDDENGLSWNIREGAERGKKDGVALCEYNIVWRCWTSRPTDAQREATPWE